MSVKKSSPGIERTPFKIITDLKYWEYLEPKIAPE
jgi:hypothetical protein